VHRINFVDFAVLASQERDNIANFRNIASARGALAPGSKSSGGEPSTGDLFAVLWRALTDMLGTAAAATLLRRAALRAAPRCPELSTLSIIREDLEYRYTVPASWSEPAAEPPRALCELTRELDVLLRHLTGSVVVNRLAQMPELRGVVPAQERS
jgi:hypothetical protein